MFKPAHTKRLKRYTRHIVMKHRTAKNKLVLKVLGNATVN